MFYWPNFFVTAGNANSVGPHSQASPSQSADDKAYIEQQKKMQKYIEPLKRMIHRIEKDEGNNILKIGIIYV